jgi:L-fuconolactonase
MEVAMITVDTHIHIGQTWYEPIETVLFHMEQNSVARAVLIQSGGNYDNSYEIDCVQRYPDRFAGVILIDTDKPDALEVVEKWSEKGAVGIRLSAQERSPGTDPLAIWRKASQLGLVVSLSAKGGLAASAGDDFRRLIEVLPDLKIVMEHLGGVGLLTGAAGGPAQEMDFALFYKILALAKYPNIFLKLPGLGEFMPKPNQPHYDAPSFVPPDTIRMAYDAFGSKRIMWGSDFPRCSGREGYTNALKGPMEKISFFSNDDREWIFGKTALSVWK